MRLKAFVLMAFLFGLMIISPESYGQANDFSGGWSYEGITDVDVGTPAQCTFTVILKQKGNKISGEYEAVALNGNRIDIDEEGGNKITGVINGNIADVQFESASWGGKGNAKITHLGNKIMWEVTKIVKPDVWCPKKVVLVKEGM